MADLDEDDDMTLRPEYRFAWDSGVVRETSDPDFTSAPDGAPPDAIEVLAQLGREDPECEVTLIGMGA